MELHTTKEHLISALSIAERLTGKKESLPVLSCILLEAKGSVLTIRATNLDAGIEIRVPAQVKESGMIAVPASVIRETTRVVTGDTIHLREVEGNLSIEARSSKNLIKAIPHEEFPALPYDKEKQGFLVSRTRLLEALESVLYAASPSMIRPELGSVYLSIEQGTITAVATDSFRLAEKKITGATKQEEGDILIPLKHAQELVYVLQRIGADEVEVRVEELQLIVSSESIRFISRVVDATFPNYKEIIPKTTLAEAVLLKSDFAELLRKARVFSGSEQHIGFHVYPGRKIFSATARSPEVGEMSDSVDAALSGEDVDINFHIGYLSDCLPVIASDSVTLSFSGVGRPLIIRGVSDASFMYLVMPLNR